MEFCCDARACFKSGFSVRPHFKKGLPESGAPGASSGFLMDHLLEPTAEECPDIEGDLLHAVFGIGVIKAT
jgi:hypothetical protein